MDGRVNVGLAVAAVILVFVSLIFGMVSTASIMGGLAWQSMNYGTFDFYPLVTGTLGIYIVVLILGIITAIFQFVVLKQWMNVLNGNIKNTIKLFSAIQTDNVSVKSEIEASSAELGNEKVPGWAFWGYLISYILSMVFAFTVVIPAITGVIALIFFLIFLYHIFSTSDSVYSKKTRAYSYLRNMKGYPQVEDISKITKRNVFLVLVLTIVTVGIYWLYLFIKLSTEINEFAKTDEAARTRLA